MSVELLKPEDMDDPTKLREFPDWVITAVNNCIKVYWDGFQSTFRQDVLVGEIRNQSPKPLSSTEVIDQRLLDVEPNYRAIGWVVIYDKPAWNEEGHPTFTFRRKGGKS